MTAVLLIPGILPVGQAASIATVTLCTPLDPPVKGSLGSVRVNLVLVVGHVGSAENCSGEIQRSNAMLVTVTPGGSPVSSAIGQQGSVRV